MESKLNKFLIAILAIVIISHVAFVIVFNANINNYKQELICNDSIYIAKIDSLNDVIVETENNAKYYEYLLHCDDIVLDSISEELEISKVKLERIREYTRISGQGNNINFLRDSINRMLNE